MESIEYLPENPLRSYFRALSRLFFEPRRFFHELSGFTLSESLAFGLATAWIGSAVAFFFSTFSTLLFSSLFENWMQRILSDESISWLSGDAFLWSAGTLILTPFFLLLRIFLASLVLFTCARLFIAEESSRSQPITFRVILQIMAVANAGRFFLIVPFFGGLLGFLVTTVLVIHGMRECFGVSNRRAIFVVLAPYIALFALALVLGTFALVIASQLSLQDLLGS